MNDYPVSISMEEAREKTLAVCGAVGAETVAVEDSLGRVLAEDVAAREDIPPFPRSPYDGYALRAGDVKDASDAVPVTLEIIEEIPAGHMPQKRVGPGQAAKILTGAPVPDGADMIVKFEDTKFTADAVTVFRRGRSGENIVPAGEDVKRGCTVMEKGSVISPAYIGLLVGLGYSGIRVYRRPRVAIISTGDELAGTGSELTPGKIRNSSAHMLKAYMENFAAVRLFGIVPDGAREIAGAIASAAEEADMIITTGGVSVGDYDMVRSAMEPLGAEILFWKTKMKPGSSCLAAVYGGKPVLCLSGNPSAAAVTYFTVGVPAIKKLAGVAEVMPEAISVKLSADFGKKSPNRRFLPGRLAIKGGEAYLETADRQGNGMLHPLHGCDVIGEIPAGSGELSAGAPIKAYRLF